MEIKALPHYQLSQNCPPSGEGRWAFMALAEMGSPSPQDPWGDPIKMYIAGSFGENRRLREGHSMSLTARWWLLGMKCRPLHEGRLYRGLREDPNLQEGEEFVDRGFVATSKSIAHATSGLYCREALFVILNGRGHDLTQKPIRDPVGPFKAKRSQTVSGEGEVVLLPGRRFRVVNKARVELPTQPGEYVIRYVLEQLN
jgi:hypothetical protein